MLAIYNGINILTTNGRDGNITKEQSDQDESKSHLGKHQTLWPHVERLRLSPTVAVHLHPCCLQHSLSHGASLSSYGPGISNTLGSLQKLRLHTVVSQGFLASEVTHSLTSAASWIVGTRLYDLQSHLSLVQTSAT